MSRDPPDQNYVASDVQTSKRFVLYSLALLFRNTRHIFTPLFDPSHSLDIKFRQAFQNASRTLKTLGNVTWTKIQVSRGFKSLYLQLREEHFNFFIFHPFLIMSNQNFSCVFIFFSFWGESFRFFRPKFLEPCVFFFFLNHRNSFFPVCTRAWNFETVSKFRCKRYE